MAVSKLRIFRHGHSQDYTMETGKVLRLKASAGARYQLVNEKGILLIGLQTKTVGQDLHVYGNDNALVLVLEQYHHYQPITNELQLMEMNATLALYPNANAAAGTSFAHSAAPVAGASPAAASVSGAEAVLAQPVSVSASQVSASGSTLPKGVLLGLGAVALLGGVAAAASGGGSGGDTSSNNTNNNNNTNTNSGSNNSSNNTNHSNNSNNNTNNNDTGNNNPQPTPPTPTTPVVTTPPVYNKPTLSLNDITADNTLNVSEANTNQIVSGSVNHAQAGDTVTLTIGQTVLRTPVAADGKTFQVNVSGAVLAANNTVSASVRSQGGESDLVSKSYTLNWQPEIRLNAITGDNIVSTQEAQQNIALSGSVNNMADGQTVKLSVNDASGKVVYQTQASVSQDKFTVNVASDVLSKGKTVQATADVVSPDGRQWHDQKSQTYEYKQAPVLTLHLITGDNLLDLTEAQASALAVSGKVENANAGDQVHITIGNARLTAQIGANGAYSVNVRGEVLAKAQTVQAVVTDAAGKSYGNTVEQKYTVEKYTEIQLDSISEDNILGLDDVMGSTRFSGSIDVSKWASAFRTKGFLKNIEVSIGNQTYDAGLHYDEQTQGYRFLIDVPNVQLQAGSPIRYKLKWQDYLDVFEFGDSRGVLHYDVRNFKLPTNFAQNITLTSDTGVLTGAQGNYSIGQVQILNEETVSGSLKGDFAANDTVQIAINNKTHTTQVNAQGQFSVKVARADLLSDSDQMIEASLQGKNATVVGKYTIVNHNNQAAATFAAENQHATQAENGLLEPEKLPYFINALDDFVQHKNMLKGFLENQTMGQHRTITYHLPTEQELARFKNGGDILQLQRDFNIMTSYQVEDLMRSEPTALNATDAATVRQALNIISEYTNITFQEVGSLQASDMDFYYNNFDLVDGQSGALGYAYFGSDVHFNSQSFSQWNQNYPSQGLQTVIHEVLHVLGLKHPHLEEGESANKVPHLTEKQDSQGVSIMSYNSDDFLEKDVPRLYDLATLHYIFGVNQKHRAENNTYHFAHFNQNEADGDVYIWDGNGVDTFDASHEAQGVNVNLTPGSWLYADRNQVQTDSFGLIQKNEVGYENKALTVGNNTYVTADKFYTNHYDFTKGVAFIGYGSQLENLLGSAHDDILTGNATDNVIQGGSGSDTISGGLGADTLLGGAGNDTISGDAGNDTIHGGLGADTLTGGAGNDRFVFDSALGDGNVDKITDFTVGNDKLVLSRGIFGENTLSDFANRIRYQASTGELSYDHDGTGTQSDFVVFATLSSQLNLDANSFELI